MHPRPRRPAARRGGFCRPTAAAVLTCSLAIVWTGSAARAASPVPPVVPGYERLRNESKLDAAAQGEILLGELNCLSCHQAEGQKRVLTKGAPDLSHAGTRLTPQYIRAYLSDPHAIKPGATMPDIFHASEAQSKQGAVEFLTHYLVSLGGPIGAASEEASDPLVEQGRTLYHSIGCIACHAPEKPAPAVLPEKGAANTSVSSVPLANLALKTTVDQLADFLMDPLKVRPGSRMPSSGLSRGEAYAIATYLLREQMTNPQAREQGPARVRGIKYTYYEEEVGTADVTKLDPLKPKSQGKLEQFALNIPGKRNDNYAVKLTGVIAIPRDGRYRFWTLSDDGSRLYVDGNLVVDNDGTHAPGEKGGIVELKKGDHPITVTYFQGGGGDELRVSWAGPQVRRQPIPADVLFTVGGKPMVPLNSEKFTVDTQKAQMGKQMFSVLGCANCHALSDVPAGRPAKALAALNVNSDEGCLGAHVRKGLPQYHLADPQRDAIKAALKNVARLNEPLTAKEQVTHTMAAMNCYGCHRRENVGGPTADRTALFVMKAEFDMGDEGRIPPQLDSVGYKLRPEAMEQIIFESKLHVRPALAARMPRFNREKMAFFPQAAAKADEVANAPTESPFTEKAAIDGRQLFGTKGLGCVNCHGVLGEKSLGMPAPDLTSVHERLRFGWFSKLMHDPASINPGTRMPAYWTGDAVAFKDLAGGTPAGQINALWAYLSLGRSMALPVGLQPLAGSELVPVDEPIVHRTFFREVGPRAVLVGFPERLSVAFDANLVRMAEVWRGRFFDTKGMWEGRGGQALGPLGTDDLKLPPGPSFAVLANPNDPWPAPHGDPDDGNIARNLGGQFKGYTFDKDRRPVFHYVLNDVDIHEQPLPVLQPGGTVLVRHFEVSSQQPVKGLYFEAAAGEKIEPKGSGVWSVDGKLTVQIKGGNGPQKLEPLVRDNGHGGKQLVLPINGNASFDVGMSW